MVVCNSIRRKCVTAGLLLVLWWVAAFVYSPWHQHSQNSNQLCSLSQYGFTFGIEAGPVALLVLPSQAGRLHLSSEASDVFEPLSTDSHGRAPPA